MSDARAPIDAGMEYCMKMLQLQRFCLNPHHTTIFHKLCAEMALMIAQGRCFC